MKRLSKHLKSEWVLKNPPYMKKDDKRYALFKGQLKTNGFCDAETWSLDSMICKFILPRLIRFKEINIGFPGGDDMTIEKWNVVLDKMIFAFDWSLNHEEEKYDGLPDKQKEKHWQQYQEGMDLFAKWFRHLWW